MEKQIIEKTTSEYVIGVDYGTDSVRALLVNAATGEEMALSVFEYPRWKKGLFCNASKNQFRQHPLDYIEGLEFTVRDLLKQCPGAAQQVQSNFNRHNWFNTRSGRQKRDATGIAS